MHLSAHRIKLFQKEILGWYKVHKRDLPWRKSRDPYSILISEVMSQQTQIPRVIPKFNNWMERFPTVQVLAKASTADILRAWSGLGYNRRALYLQKAAQVIVQQYNGIFPQTQEELKKLPGIGEYTSAALLCFAFNKQIALVDTNIRKVILLRFFSLVNHEQISGKQIQEIAKQLLPQGRAYEWNQALMDYSSAVLKKEKVPVPKQSPFLTSKRFVRGQILKLLLSESHMSSDSLILHIAKKTSRESSVVKEIVNDLEKEGFIKKENGHVKLRG
jgi:A/G-specific adenine glycosylase